MHTQCDYDNIFAFFPALFLLGFCWFALFNPTLISFHSCKLTCLICHFLKHLADIAKKGVGKRARICGFGNSRGLET